MCPGHCPLSPFLLDQALCEEGGWEGSSLTMRPVQWVDVGRYNEGAGVPIVQVFAAGSVHHAPCLLTPAY